MLTSHSDATINPTLHGQLDLLRQAAHAGNELAPAAALFFCKKYDVPVPTWLVPLAADSFCQQLKPKEFKKRGRSAGTLERLRQDMTDYERFETVLYIRQEQLGIKDELDFIEKCDPHASKNGNDSWNTHVQERASVAKWLGRTLDRAYECASAMLIETPAYGGADAIKASYHRVKKNSENPEQAWRYFPFEWDFLESIGLQHPTRWPQSRKWRCLFDLTQQ